LASNCIENFLSLSRESLACSPVSERALKVAYVNTMCLAHLKHLLLLTALMLIKIGWHSELGSWVLYGCKKSDLKSRTEASTNYATVTWK